MALYRWGQLLGSEPRRAGWTLVGGVALLLAVGVYLLALQHGSVRSNANTSTLDVARGLDASISARFSQSIASLQGIAADLAAAPRTDAAALQALRNAARYDPFSNWLGAVSADGRSLIMVDAAGTRAPPAMEADVLAALHAPPDQGVGLQPLLHPSAHGEWLMPVSLRIANGGTALALVSASRIAAGAQSLKLLPDSVVALIGTDGSRLLRYTRGMQALDTNGPPLTADRLAALSSARGGNLDFVSTLDQRHDIAGYVRSERLPLYVAVLVPVDALDRQWLRESIGPALVLLLGLTGIVVFGIRLRRALQLQQQALERQSYLAEHDMLTGLLNRDAFVRRLTQALQQPDAGNVAVALLDLGNFKAINDTLGHEVGDQALVEVGLRFARLARAAEGARFFIARLGGTSGEWARARCPATSVSRIWPSACTPVWIQR